MAAVFHPGVVEEMFRINAGLRRFAERLIEEAALPAGQGFINGDDGHPVYPATERTATGLRRMGLLLLNAYPSVLDARDFAEIAAVSFDRARRDLAPEAALVNFDTALGFFKHGCVRFAGAMFAEAIDADYLARRLDMKVIVHELGQLARQIDELCAAAGAPPLDDGLSESFQGGRP